MEYFTLNNGIKMPMAGIGVFLLKPAEAEASVLSALTDGIRLIDTANAYMNEKAVGRAMQRSNIKREEIFLVSKLWPTVYEDDQAIDETLKRLDTEYVDVLLLHQPAGNWKYAYKMMEKAYKEGKVKALGLSNFPMEWVKEIITDAEIKPQVVQVEAHPYYPQTELKKHLSETGMGLMAWYPLGHGDSHLLNEPVFTELAEKYGKMNAQIILRWHIQSGNIIIPGSKNPCHIRQNSDIFDFTLTEEEMEKIKTIDKNRRYYNATVEEAQKYTRIKLDFNNQE